jgi:putative RNA 2'-phosphotransferase
MSNLTKLSKFLSLMLRHRAADFGLTLDSEGFTDLDVVWAQVEKRFGVQYSRDDLHKVTEKSNDGKARFEIIDGRIRARYGHSAVRTITYPAVTPPEYLYHGTTREALDSIRQEGLTSQNRQFVHLSLDSDWAQTVGARHSKNTVVLRVRALEAHEAGHIFHHPEPKHYLVLAIPPEFIDFP